MSKISDKKAINDQFPDLKKTQKRTVIGFVVLGVVQVIYFIGSFFLGRFIGYFEHNDLLFYPYNRNANLKASVGLFIVGVANAIYIALNKRISLRNNQLTIGMKVSIPLVSWGLSEFLIYRLGYISSQPIWDSVSTLYGVYDRRKDS